MRIAKRLEFHHTPKHGSWLNIAEIEFSVLSRACLKGRNPDEDALQRDISAYQIQRNAAATTINWRFTTKDARTEMRRLYLCTLPIQPCLPTNWCCHAVADLGRRVSAAPEIGTSS